MNRDAVVAECDRADDGFTRQRTAAATQPVIQPLDPEDGPLADAAALPLRTGIPLRHESPRQFLIRGGRHLTFRQQPDLLPQTVEHLVQGDGSESQ
jgi:hypothetical protein